MKYKGTSKKGARRGTGQAVAAVVMALVISFSGAGTTALLLSQPAGLTVEQAPAEQETAKDGSPAVQEKELAEDAAAVQPEVTVTVAEEEAAAQDEEAAQTEAAAQQQSAAAEQPEQTQSSEQNVSAKKQHSVEVTAGDIEEENAVQARFVQETPELAAEDPLAAPDAVNSAAQRAAQAMEQTALMLTPEQVEQALDEGALDALPDGQSFDLADENCLTWLWEWLTGLFAPQYSGWHTDSSGNTYYYDETTHTAYTGIHTIDGVLYCFDANGVKQNVTFGIDVSKYQASIDWNKVKTSGVEFVIIRLGYRGYTTGTLVEDPMFESHYAGARAAGLRVGVYAFSQAVNENEAREEAQACVYVLDGRPLDYPIYFDSEASGSSNGTGRADGLGVDDRTTCAVAFCEEVKALGYQPGVYASTLWFNTRLDMSRLSGYSIWNAHYNVAQSSVACDLWQGTCNGRVNGYSGSIDVNVSYIG